MPGQQIQAGTKTAQIGVIWLPRQRGKKVRVAGVEEHKSVTEKKRVTPEWRRLKLQ